MHGHKVQKKKQILTFHGQNNAWHFFLSAFSSCYLLQFGTSCRSTVAGPLPHHFISPFSLAIDMQVFELNHAMRELGTCCFSG